jgi:hypothetical protein
MQITGRRFDGHVHLARSPCLSSSAPTALRIPAWGTRPRLRAPVRHALKGLCIVLGQNVAHGARPMRRPFRARSRWSYPQGVASLCPGLVCNRTFSAQEADHRLLENSDSPTRLVCRTGHIFSKLPRNAVSIGPCVGVPGTSLMPVPSTLTSGRCQRSRSAVAG